MHVIFRESHGLEETDTPQDLGQSPADLVVLSFSDSDLGAFAAGWHQEKAHLPSLRLANLTALKHPLSVDTYIEKTLIGARGILIRLIGGMPYWSYGLQQVRALAIEKGIALAVLPADGRIDPQLDEISTLPISTLRQLSMLCETGGAPAARAALAQLALASGLYARPDLISKSLPQVGAWTHQSGIVCPNIFNPDVRQKPLIILSFYLSYLRAADLAPIEAISRELEQHGYDTLGLFAPSLKEPQAAGWLTRQIKYLKPAAIINATAFSGKGSTGASPLDAAGVPVFQMALATSTRSAWRNGERGLSPADLAMHVVLPEVDGRIFSGVASFKQPGVKDPELEFSRFAHQPDKDRIKALARRVRAHIVLQDKNNNEKKPALILSTYPGKHWQMAHAVGLDAIASAKSILNDLADEGYHIEPSDDLPTELEKPSLKWPVDDYQKALKSLSGSLQKSLKDIWGNPQDDPLVSAGFFEFSAIKQGNALVALQPERGWRNDRDSDYHDTSRTPRHSYVAFYLWLREVFGADALIHIGAHGTLEWLPGKSVALSSECWPETLIGDLPVIYPFIVNDPGEAAQAKRRIGAITLGHVPPALKQSAVPDRMSQLEALLDEFSNADGLDPKRRDRLQLDIRSEAQALGVEADLGLDKAASAAEAITRIDRFVCDIKESQYGDGLHVFGRTSDVKSPIDITASAQNERRGLLAALAGKRIESGPSGSPYRGRSDVLPTGRNLYTTDPRAVPTRSAYAQGVKLAEELVRRHLQDQGEYPKNLIVDLWGSATMRTAGEEFAMALHLLGVKPKWDKGSERVSGIEIIPIAELERPRLDVTLRVSGLFRDVFPTLTALFSQAVRSLAKRDEAIDWNPFVAAQHQSRVFGPAPASYGLGMTDLTEHYTDQARAAAGQAWLKASAYAFDGENVTHQPQAIAERVAKADSFVHLQDLCETDLLLAADYATHEAGFAAAQSVTGGSAALYHMDNTRPETPRARSLPEEIARVVQSRASNPNWIAGMQRHGFRGAAEIAATLDHMASFAQLADVVSTHLFDLYYEATLDNAEVCSFLEDKNPQAYLAMKSRFEKLHQAGLWKSRRNSVIAAMEGAA